jgi:predicted dehydrogenase
MSDPTSPPRVRVAIFGAGSRGADAYGAYLLRRPDLAQVVAIADPREDRLQAAGARHDVAVGHLYASWEQLLRDENGLDAIIIATPDALHLEPALAAIRHGVSILLEKPICPTEPEIRRLLTAARRRHADITVAHVLRYTPFFARIKELLDRGVIGQLQTVRHSEQIGYWHFAHSYVRGNWRRVEDSSPMILAKACHDFDILQWLIGSPCVELSSYGNLGHFSAEHAPEGSTERCDQGCKVERSCPYSAQHIYLEKLPPGDRWPHNVLTLDTSPEGLALALHEGPYGRCVYHCDNDVADHQVVSMRFANGVDASMNVSGFTRDNTRTIHLMGSQGEIVGNFTANEISVTDFRIDDVRTSQISVLGDAIHGGGDDGIMADFIGRVQDRLRGGDVSSSMTSLEESADGHFMAFAAETSRLRGTAVHLHRGHDQRRKLAPVPATEGARE